MQHNASWGGIVHGSLDAAGLVPGFGEAADLLNAGLYLAEGDYLNAGLSGGSALGPAGYIFSGIKIANKVENGLDVAKAAERAGAGGTDDVVSVFHGSVDDATDIAKHGLAPNRTPTWASRDINAAHDAVHGAGRVDTPRDPGIIESRIPRDDFDRLMKPSERPYGGFNGNLPGSSEIVLRSADQIALFNRYRVAQ